MFDINLNKFKALVDRYHFKTAIGMNNTTYIVELGEGFSIFVTTKDYGENHYQKKGTLNINFYADTTIDEVDSIMPQKAVLFMRELFDPRNGIIY